MYGSFIAAHSPAPTNYNIRKKNMNRPLRYGLYLPLSLAVGAVAVVLRTVACLTVRDGYGYFPGSPLVKIAAWMLFGLCLFLASYPLLTRPPKVRGTLFETPVSYFPTGILAAAQFLLCTGLCAPAFRTTGMAGVTGKITVLLGFAGCIYFVLCLLSRDAENTCRSVFGCAECLFCAAYAVYLYFDASLPLNSTCKVTSQAVFLFFACYMLLDTRVSLGRPLLRLQAAVGGMAFILAVFGAFPAAVTWVATGDVIDNSLYETVFTAAFAVFLGMRVYSLSRLPADVPSPFVEAVAAAVAAKEAADEQPTGSENESSENDEKQ